MKTLEELQKLNFRGNVPFSARVICTKRIDMDLGIALLAAEDAYIRLEVYNNALFAKLNEGTCMGVVLLSEALKQINV